LDGIKAKAEGSPMTDIKPIELIHQTKKYNIIYADPPWFYNPRTRKTKYGKTTRSGGGASSHYSLMKTEDIKKLPIGALADENASLFLWVTFPRLQDGLDVMKAWGFEYKTTGFTWTKLNKKNGKAFFGTGNYTKSNSEVCLLGIKGRMKPVSDKVSSVIISPLTTHSEKPSEARSRIVELYGELPRIELFSRHKNEGWDCWGNEVESSVNVMNYGFVWNLESLIKQCIPKSLMKRIRNISKCIDSPLNVITAAVERDMLARFGRRIDTR
jgi:N6-adenosine-specific RNA methylase IME4